MIDHARQQLAELVRWIHGRGWAPGTGGNFSLRVSSDPLLYLITPSGADKGAVQPLDLLVCDADGRVVDGGAAPSAETLLHVPIYEATDAEVVVHTHSIWNTLASLKSGSDFRITGLEMLKGLEGNRSHEVEEFIPILENSQDIAALAATMRDTLERGSGTHAVLLRGHGLYTWGRSIFEVRRHLEILEFLFEVVHRWQLER